MTDRRGLDDRLQAHVDAILDRSAVSNSDRADLAEELYGHLWQRWQELQARGDDPETALAGACDAFGDPASLARDMTRAYHSRLYASTVGALLPSVASITSARPRGALGLQLVMVGVIAQAAVGLIVAVQTLTPVRLLATVASLVLAAVVAALAIRAIGRGQRWAVRLGRIAVSLGLVEGAITLLDGPGLMISPLGLIALLAALPALSPDLDSWAARSRPIRRRLGIPLAAFLVLGFVMPAIAPSLPDPTQVGPSDLHLSTTVTCSPDGGGTAVTVVASITWDRVDAWPNGLASFLASWDRYTAQPGDEAFDGITAGVIEKPTHSLAAYIGATIDPNEIVAYPAAMLMSTDPEVLMGPNGSTIPATRGGTYWSGAYAQGLTVAPGEYEAGKTYTSKWVASEPTAIDPAHPPIFFISYAHLDRFLVEAVATCGGNGVGVPVAPLIAVAGG